MPDITPRRRLSPAVLAELERLGLPWELKPGKRHFKLYVGGVMATIVPFNNPDATPTHDRKSIGCIRRVARNRCATSVD